jgi:hypothetical protein
MFNHGTIFFFELTSVVTISAGMIHAMVPRVATSYQGLAHV